MVKWLTAKSEGPTYAQITRKGVLLLQRPVSQVSTEGAIYLLLFRTVTRKLKNCKISPLDF
jgi:hypothetical protein